MLVPAEGIVPPSGGCLLSRHKRPEKGAKKPMVSENFLGVQTRKQIATDPAPGNDTSSTRLLPLCVQTCHVPRPPNSAGLLRGNESCFAAGALFGRNGN